MKSQKTRVSLRQKKKEVGAIAGEQVEKILPTDNERAAINQGLGLSSDNSKVSLDRRGTTASMPASCCENLVKPVKAATPPLPDFGNASAAACTAYVDAIRQAAPTLGDIFALVTPEVVEKPIAERSTNELIIQIDAGKFLAEIAHLWRVPASDLNRWIVADADRFTKANLARKNQAALWDWVALQVLLHAPSDRVEIARAEKIARHCRWRAEMFNRDDYGQSLKVTQMDERNARELTTHELEIIARGGGLPG